MYFHSVNITLSKQKCHKDTIKVNILKRLFTKTLQNNPKWILDVSSELLEKFGALIVMMECSEGFAQRTPFKSKKKSVGEAGPPTHPLTINK